MPIHVNTYTIQDEEITIAVEVDDTVGQEVIVATPPDPDDPDDPYQDLRDGRLEKVRSSFEDGLELAKDCAKLVVSKMQDMGETVRPDEFQIQFAVKLSAEKGAFIAKAAAEAQLQVSMTWKNEKS